MGENVCPSIDDEMLETMNSKELKLPQASHTGRRGRLKLDTSQRRVLSLPPGEDGTHFCSLLDHLAGKREPRR